MNVPYFSRQLDANVQVAQLLLRDLGRRVGQRAGGGLRLREGDDVTDRVGAGHQHREPVEAERDPAMWRRAVLERVEQEAELLLGLLRADAEHLEHGRLHIIAMDTHRAAADLGAVQHHVVRTRQAPGPDWP